MEYVNIKTFQKTKFLFVEYRRVEISYSTLHRNLILAALVAVKYSHQFYITSLRRDHLRSRVASHRR